jgi:hypothetical protein
MNAFIYDISVLRRWSPELKQYQYCLGFCDFHDKLDVANGQQMAKINHCLCNCRPHTLHMLTEDLSSAGCGGRKSCGNFIIDSRGGVLGGLATRCRNLGITVDNVEYRYCRVVAFAPVMHSMRSNIHVDLTNHILTNFPSVQQVRIADLVQEMFEVMQEVRKYEDGAKLTSWYQKTLQDIHANCTELQLQKHAELTIAQYLMSHLHPMGDRAALLKQLLMFDSNLVDLKLAHAIVSTKKPFVAVFAGGSHIDRVVDMLNKVGYERVYHAGAQWRREYDFIAVTKIPQSNMRPRPVSPRALDHVLEKMMFNKNF